MPCRDGRGYDSREYAYEDTSRVDKLARIACELARFIEKGYGSRVWKEEISKEAANWWDAHKKADEAREAREAKARRVKEIKASAIKKLSLEERKALGL